jgi:hypothetical protein
MLPVVQKSESRGEDISRIVNKMIYVLQNDSRTDAIIACLTLAIALQKEDIDPEKMLSGVLGASQWICTFLSDVPEIGGKVVLN